MWIPVLVGGAAAGLLSGVPWVNCLCCLWILGGAALSVFLYAQAQPGSTSPGDGAVIGAFSGVVAAGVNTLLNIVFQSANLAFLRRVIERLSANMDNFPAEWRDWMSREPGPVSVAQLIVSFAFSAAVFAALGALGGILGASLFGKRSAGRPPDGPVPPPAVPQEPR
jgi:hypothetical protein